MFPRSIEYKLLLVLALLSFSCLRAEEELSIAEPCEPEKCQAPNCRCSGLKVLRDEFAGSEKKIPQFITVTFDDAVNYHNFAQYEELFSGLTNPDNCSAHGTFFVSHEYTDYSKVHALYTEGHEIAVHSVTHGTGHEYWLEADEDLLMREFGNEIEMLETFALVNRRHIRGMRMPYLQIAGNLTFAVGKKLGLQYDSSWPTATYKNAPMWPYTLDFESLQGCPIGPCPDAAIPGFWVSPMVTWSDLEGHNCAMVDACVFIPKPDEIDDIFDWMVDNFNRHYESNRAPFGMYLHAALFDRHENYLKAFRKFLEYAGTLDDVYVVTMSQVLQYMRNPNLGKPFKGCFKRPQTKKCWPKSCSLLKVSTDEMRYMTVCGKCPQVYPWLDNPLGLKNMATKEHSVGQKNTTSKEHSEERPLGRKKTSSKKQSVDVKDTTSEEHSVDISRGTKKTSSKSSKEHLDSPLDIEVRSSRKHSVHTPLRRKKISSMEESVIEPLREKDTTSKEPSADIPLRSKKTSSKKQSVDVKDTASEEHSVDISRGTKKTSSKSSKEHLDSPLDKEVRSSRKHSVHTPLRRKKISSMEESVIEPLREKDTTSKEHSADIPLRSRKTSSKKHSGVKDTTSKEHSADIPSRFRKTSSEEHSMHSRLTLKDTTSEEE